MKTLFCVIIILGFHAQAAITPEQKKAWEDSQQVIDGYLAENDIYSSSRKVGTWGGEYKCPSGKIYEIGDNKDYCRSLAGKGGEMLSCYPTRGPWTRQTVDCALPGVDYQLAKLDQ